MITPFATMLMQRGWSGSLTVIALAAALCWFVQANAICFFLGATVSLKVVIIVQTWLSKRVSNKKKAFSSLSWFGSMMLLCAFTTITISCAKVHYVCNQ